MSRPRSRAHWTPEAIVLMQADEDPRIVEERDPFGPPKMATDTFLFASARDDLAPEPNLDQPAAASADCFRAKDLLRSMMKGTETIPDAEILEDE
jgi:hypothetical protein